jgi:hypothetical protein
MPVTSQGGLPARRASVRRIVVALCALTLQACSGPHEVIPLTIDLSGEPTWMQPYPPHYIDCDSDQFVFASALGQLPGEIRSPAGRRVEIADMGEDYNGGRGPVGLPGHRFAGAAVGRDHIFVVIQGETIAVASSDELWAFERHGTRWTGHPRAGGGSTLQEILFNTCKRPTQPGHLAIGSLQMTCDLDGRGLLSIRYDGPDLHGNFEVRTRDTGRWTFRAGDIRAIDSGAPLSISQQAGMRQTLQTALASMRESDDCRFVADRYLEALTRPGGSPEPTATPPAARP